MLFIWCVGTDCFIPTGFPIGFATESTFIIPGIKYLIG